MSLANSCSHFDQIHTRHGNTEGCEECLKIGDTWVHLRVCLVCGKTGCCDDSKNKHASRHFRETGHPLIRSKEPGETWGWCYVDRRMFDPI
ncbi:MAG: UBP-type zinc finger domain-containing protein [Massilia sp.]